MTPRIHALIKRFTLAGWLVEIDVNRTNVYRLVRKRRTVVLRDDSALMAFGRTLGIET